MKETISDKKVILGIGIGLVIASFLMISFPTPKISESELIKLAKERGMVFPDEVKAFYIKGEAK